MVVLGDQLSTELPAFEGFDKGRDVVWMAEVSGESEYVWSSKQRSVLFLSAMRHFRDELREAGCDVRYRELGDEPGQDSLEGALTAFLGENSFGKVRLTWPGEYRLVVALQEVCKRTGVACEILEDNWFFCSRADFAKHLEGRKQPRMEYFYREMRRRYGVLMDGGEPAGGKWNFDTSNRKPFGKEGPETLGGRRSFDADETTREVMDLVECRFSKHPGKLDTWIWPVTREQALQALEDFIEWDLPRFGEHQDAMWTGEPFLRHSLLASSINLHLLRPSEVVAAAEEAYRKGAAGIESTEGFIRQILGWREYVRGIYWNFMPEYLERNAMGALEPLPAFYWDGDTEMLCLREAIGQTLKYGYAHHIQRLMVTGLYALLLGVKPQEVHAWYLAVYVDAVEWVELPNTLGMSQFGDGGLLGSKPYVASGKYIKRMSNYCDDCRFDPDLRSGEKACPFTALYWDYLLRHEDLLKGNPRMTMQLRNLKRISEGERSEILETAKKIKKDNRSKGGKRYGRT